MEYTQQSEWNAHYAEGKSFRPLGASEQALLATHLHPKPGSRALDVGCGLGELARHLARCGYQADAVDFAESMALSPVRRRGMRSAMAM
ncbi:class I SAM-dependent methyltransferase [Streptomyces sp. NBC_00658]|uniref:class I SAM-dependent methyltransferase n=1 Tax=Streptomyces sp. NBC_00658 TaxID=2975800 RepID=UPI0032439F84